MTLSSWSVGLNDTVILGGRRANAAPRVATWDVRYAAELCQASWGTRDRGHPAPPGAFHVALSKHVSYRLSHDPAGIQCRKMMWFAYSLIFQNPCLIFTKFKTAHFNQQKQSRLIYSILVRERSSKTGELPPSPTSLLPFSFSCV